MDLFNNFPLWSALIAIAFAQIVKVPIEFIATRKLNWGLIFSTGGMPSSHSAAVTSLTTGIGLIEGVDSPLFAVSTVFAVIVMFDATGVRRHAGEQATVLNRLVEDFNRAVEEAKMWPTQAEREKQEKLKELLGHQPIEVFFGAITGIAVAFLVYLLWYM
ncbi:divergent PAP2 family protein [Metabacillus iocasae]|uniref:Acid phosphatase family membrane protein YuiD n=1 Tax=Priestia iocasae TaxID=2291674 RepID=A0ABS2QYQ2_9BACI|nr:divergent PAP2 family protein [Metabacillus iocasae]MBM7704619.1 acid phosphatase family membrane protein YuiD [Metabacillus iocasae]